MQKTCPSCGADIFPGARFCRRCGAPLREEAGTGEVSPRAETVPLQQAEGRVTEALAPEDGRPSADTTRVSLSEMEHILRSQQDALNSKPAQAPHSAVTRPGVPADEDVTITVPRRGSHDTRDSAALDPERTLDSVAARDLDDFEVTRDAPAAVPHDAREDDEELTHVAASPAATRANAAHPSVPVSQTNVAGVRPPAPPTRKRRWPVVVGVCVAVILAAGAVTFLAFKLLRRPSLTDLPSQGPTAPTPAPDAAQRFEEKMAEAEALLAQGNMDAALQSLRDANAIDPSNSRAHRRLGELLLAAGARREAIEELKAAARNAPDDSATWKQLAMAQFAEGLYRDAAESYRRLFALVGDAAADPNDLLAYADSLRLSGRAEEARAVYQKLTNVPQTDVAESARRHLAELAQSQPTPTPTPHAGEQTNTQPREDETASLTQPTPQPTPTPAPREQPTPTPAPPRETAATPEAHYRQGQQLWSSDRGSALNEFRAAAAGGNYDAHYYLGLSYVEGRNLHALKRAEVVAALQHFQLAQRGRQFVAESRRYQQQLEKEFDRLRGQ
ncbi:MAG TPA: tetratricopeptide repeat protein [Pyrinomonadaceae bacterium]|jgi:tetratricopeptide (TPR) repeat protein|nr:tetratricopeptide repeat protein [Pyrinomonadaceae bacterium]